MTRSACARSESPTLAEDSFDDFAAPQAPALTTGAASAGPGDKVKTLVSRGSNEEDAKVGFDFLCVFPSALSWHVAARV